jgi:glycosyltransferase involved in cell wall biosynthesis
MRVLFDEQVFLLQKRGGVSRYFVELIKVFKNTPSLGVEPILNFETTSNQFLLELAKELDVSESHSPKFIELTGGAIRANFKNSNFDILHHTFYSKLFWQPRFKGTRLSTHYDMIPEIFHESRLGINPHLSKHWYFNNVNHILSISESARNDLNEIWPDVKTPISITHLGRPELQHKSLDRLKGYIIFVGARSGYKDAETMLRAFAKLPENLKVKLEFIGGGAFSESENAVIHSLGIGGFVSQRNVTDSELIDAYSKAHAFVFPSKYEGFGLPALESLQLGCRTILAKTPALIEVAGDCADYFNPGNSDELSALLSKVLSHSPSENPHLESGLNRASQFSWLETARKTAKIYESLL